MHPTQPVKDTRPNVHINGGGGGENTGMPSLGVISTQNVSCPSPMKRIGGVGCKEGEWEMKKGENLGWHGEKRREMVPGG